MPVDAPVPAGQAIAAPPAPYDPAEHGRLLANTAPEANLARAATRAATQAAPPRREPPARGRRADGRPNPFPGSGDRGFWITDSHGVYASNDVHTDLSIPSSAIGTTIYAPTHMPASNACIETVTAHWRYEGMSTTAHGHGFWDHCGTDGSTGWQVFESMTAAWKSSYVRVFDGEERYFTQADRDANGCWRGLLYNFTQGAWEAKVNPPVCGQSSWASGWTMWESHHLMDQTTVCPTFPSIRASGIQVLTAGSGYQLLTPVRSSNLGPYGRCWTQGDYTFQVNQANYDWQGLTPTG